MDMDDEKDPGEVFAIPDLWGPSDCLSIGNLDGHTFLFSQLKLDGLQFPSERIYGD
jgi:hypothetical protein